MRVRVRVSVRVSVRARVRVRLRVLLAAHRVALARACVECVAHAEDHLVRVRARARVRLRVRVRVKVGVGVCGPPGRELTLTLTTWKRANPSPNHLEER